MLKADSHLRVSPKYVVASTVRVPAIAAGVGAEVDSAALSKARRKNDVRTGEKKADDAPKGLCQVLS